MFPLYSVYASSILAAVLYSGAATGRDAGNTTCASTQLDWYTNVVGETPCATYQRLRQICNVQYQVPAFRPNTPGDNCDDQVSECCCNSISWALSMLCMNCQYDLDGGPSYGIDAGAGAYGLYTATCGRPMNKTLPRDVQSAVCNEEIKIDQNLYSLFWDDGSCVYTMETMTKDFAATDNNTFTACNSTLKPSISPGGSSIPATPTSSSSSVAATSLLSTPQVTGNGATASSSTDLAPIIGGAVGGVAVALALVLLGFFLFRRQRRRQGPKPLDLSKEYSGGCDDHRQMTAVTPFSVSSEPSSTFHVSIIFAELVDTINLHAGSGYGGGKVALEEFALLPRTPQQKYPPSRSRSQSPAGEHEPVRHEDAGPLPVLQRSASGRLPPAYRHSWEASDPPALDVPQYDHPLEQEGPRTAISSPEAKYPVWGRGMDLKARAPS
ncbi:hypothetical protein BD414DRAFT_426655 [Trametes punicea]|nr:hypothetical protein BD414DRAFT_426655 [Trametes punicea]